MNEVHTLYAHIRWCHGNLAIIERRSFKGFGWQREHDGWHAYIAADWCRLRQLGL
jgi:hypothetical protein